MNMCIYDLLACVLVASTYFSNAINHISTIANNGTRDIPYMQCEQFEVFCTAPDLNACKRLLFVYVNTSG